MPSLALTIVVGLSAPATTVALLAITLLSIFQHTNVRTPRWLGYVVRSPESHSWHHARDRHRDNYADVPLFDILFGTFLNPRDFALATGFTTAPHGGSVTCCGSALCPGIRWTRAERRQAELECNGRPKAPVACFPVNGVAAQ